MIKFLFFILMAVTKANGQSTTTSPMANGTESTTEGGNDNTESTTASNLPGSGFDYGSSTSTMWPSTTMDEYYDLYYGYDDYYDYYYDDYYDYYDYYYEDDEDSGPGEAVLKKLNNSEKLTKRNAKCDDLISDNLAKHQNLRRTEPKIPMDIDVGMILISMNELSDGEDVFFL